MNKVWLSNNFKEHFVLAAAMQDPLDLVISTSHFSSKVPCLVVTSTDTETQTQEEISICQSASIMRFLGRISSLSSSSTSETETNSFTSIYPSDNLVESAFIDSLLDQEIDLFTGIRLHSPLLFSIRLYWTDFS